MTDSQMTSLRHTSRWIGIIGIVAALASWAVLVLLNGSIASWPDLGSWSVANFLVSALSFGIPGTGGVMVAFWIAVTLWTRAQTTPAPEQTSSNHV
ncbi:MAG: hypothetical protein FWF43_09140 [Propionibacteriaceae bacterium]|nr:hypothetical protein [Propionibacteriaceae bacterium]